MSLAQPESAVPAKATDPRLAALLRIGSLELKSRVIPAPMCNVSDRPFRGLNRSAGAHLVTTQMVSCEGLVRHDRKTWDLLDIAGEEAPVAVQLLGSNPEVLAEAARLIVDQGAALVDFNMGCPARNVTGNACGSALMKEPELVARIVRTIRAAISVPFTVKMRAGWDGKDFSALKLAKICESEGAEAVCLHARTREQGYRGQADWSLIAAMRAELQVPVIGNGDVVSPAHAVRMFRETGCDAVMIGRGLIGNPWLFRACETAMTDYLAGRITHEDQVPDDDIVVVEEDGVARPMRVPFYMSEVTLRERLDLVLRHTRLMVEAKGERRGVLEMRKHSQHYIRGIRGCKALREQLMKIETEADIARLLEEYRVFLGTD